MPPRPPHPPRKPGSPGKPAPRPAEGPEARSLAQRCLEEVLLQQQDVQLSLDKTLRAAPGLDPRDRGLTTELVYGTLRLKGRLDYLVAQHLRAPEKLPQRLHILLAQCAYALVRLERVPAYATVDWGVRWSTKNISPALGKLVNAVLRKISGLGSQAAAPDFYRRQGEPETRFLARYYSCPEWIVALWRKAYGPEQTLQLLEAQAAPPLLGLRLNPRHPDSAALAARLAGHESCRLTLPHGVALSGNAALPDLEALESAGALSRQSLAALQALQELGAFASEGESGWPLPIWDACAGHGGKACALLEGLPPRESATPAPLWASDSAARRFAGLRQELRRLRLPEIPVFLADATRPPLGLRPGTVLLDAPCSGLGVLSRRPDGKWRRTPADVADLTRLQSRLLHAAAELLPPEGRLVYLTCTLHPAENEAQVDAFLAQRPGWRVLRHWRTPADSVLGEFFFGVVLGRTGAD